MFPEHGLVKAPKHLGDVEASTLPIASVTAWMSLEERIKLRSGRGAGDGGEVVVLLQGTGGVAVAGLQIAKALGAIGMFIAVPFGGELVWGDDANVLWV